MVGCYKLTEVKVEFCHLTLVELVLGRSRDNSAGGDGQEGMGFVQKLKVVESVQSIFFLGGEGVEFRIKVMGVGTKQTILRIQIPRSQNVFVYKGRTLSCSS